MSKPYTSKEAALSGGFFGTPTAVMNHPTLSLGAKQLYTRILDRMSLSDKNGWRDASGEIFVYYANSSICADLHCGSDKATRLLRELETEGLIRREKQYLCRPDRIYARIADEDTQSRDPHFQDSGIRKISTPESAKSVPQAPQNQDAGVPEIRSPESAKSGYNHSNINQNKYNHSENNHRPAAPGGAAGNGKEKSIFLERRDERGSNDGQRKEDPCLFPGSEEKKQKLGPRMRAALDRMNAALPGSPEYNEAAAEYEGLMYQMLL